MKRRSIFENPEILPTPDQGNEKISDLKSTFEKWMLILSFWNSREDFRPL